jgi:hypothetical protein
MQTADAPSSNRFSHFYCESAVVTDVNRQTWTCTVQTVHSSKTYAGVQWSSPYHHYTGGEGIHFMPEVGAHCFLAMPNDGTPAFIMAFVAPPAVKTASSDAPIRSNENPGGSTTDVSYQSNRLDLNPGDLAMTTRDGNFLILRRGGIVQLGATPMAQRLYVPVRNFIHDFAENYELATPAGDVTWLVDRPELDPAGKAACSWTFHLQEFATDKMATVRVRHLPLAAAGGQKAAWEVSVAPNSIDRSSGAVGSATYTMLVTTSGEFTEMVGASRSIEIKANDELKIGGDQTTAVTGASKLTAKSVFVEASANATMVGKLVKLGDANATQPGVLGNALVEWARAALIDTPMGPMPFTQPTLAALLDVLSKTVMLK